MIVAERDRFATFGIAADQLKWRGSPRTGIAFQPSDVFMVPMSLLFLGFGIFWEAMVVRTGVVFMMIWGIPFVAYGLYLVAGRFFWDSYARSNTYYALTSDSALILRDGFRGAQLSVYLPTVSQITLEKRDDGSGTIYFGPKPDWMMPFGWRGAVPKTPAFEMIPEVASVFRLCQELQRQHG